MQTEPIIINHMESSEDILNIKMTRGDYMLLMKAYEVAETKRHHARKYWRDNKATTDEVIVRKVPKIYIVNIESALRPRELTPPKLKIIKSEDSFRV